VRSGSTSTACQHVGAQHLVVGLRRLGRRLGMTDESHIIRTVEYWDTERRRWPQYEHVAVIVAEEITGRFFNVISLFNGFIPIIANLRTCGSPAWKPPCGHQTIASGTRRPSPEDAKLRPQADSRGEWRWLEARTAGCGARICCRGRRF
jgi:hypothetical protein